jgi:hypothetical protein
MVTYHYVKMYVSIIIHLEVININVRNFNLKIMKQYSFKYAEPSVNNISTFYQVADQLLQQNIER